MSQIIQLTEDRLDEAVDAMCSAFIDDPLFAFLWPDRRLRVRCMQPMMKANLRLTLPDGHTWAVEVDGTIAGCLGAVPPGLYPHTLGRLTRYMVSLVARPRLYLPPGSRLLTAGPKYMKQWDAQHYDGPHWYIYLLGMDKSFQGRGLGRRLVQHVGYFSKRDNKPCYLETQTQENIGFYQSLGFKVTNEAHPCIEGPGTWGFIKTP